MGAYTFDDISKVKKGRIGGRNAFSKQFRQELLQIYGSKDAITGETLDDLYLQIDHRVPYEVAGDDNGDFHPKDFMLLDASSNRAKSWVCEHCDNFLDKHNLEACKRCFWASPEDYDHIAGTATRRVEIVWSGEDVRQFEKLKAEADETSIEISSLIKKKLGE